jgi:hypothetical protein
LVNAIINIRKRDTRYQFTVGQKLSGEYFIEDSQFNIDFAPSYQTYSKLDDKAIITLD